MSGIGLGNVAGRRDTGWQSIGGWNRILVLDAKLLLSFGGHKDANQPDDYTERDQQHAQANEPPQGPG